jgi:hypothetical protein
LGGVEQSWLRGWFASVLGLTVLKQLWSWCLASWTPLALVATRACS